MGRYIFGVKGKETYWSGSESSVSKLDAALLPNDSELALFEGRSSLDPLWLPDTPSPSPLRAGSGLCSDAESLSPSLNFVRDRFGTKRESLLLESMLPLRLSLPSPSLRTLSFKLATPLSIDLRKVLALCSLVVGVRVREADEASASALLLDVGFRMRLRRRSGEGDLRDSGPGDESMLDRNMRSDRRNRGTF